MTLTYLITLVNKDLLFVVDLSLSLLQMNCVTVFMKTCWLTYPLTSRFPCLLHLLKPELGALHANIPDGWLAQMPGPPLANHPLVIDFMLTCRLLFLWTFRPLRHCFKGRLLQRHELWDWVLFLLSSLFAFALRCLLLPLFALLTLRHLALLCLALPCLAFHLTSPPDLENVLSRVLSQL